jgi:hypothetical protein
LVSILKLVCKTSFHKQLKMAGEGSSSAGKHFAYHDLDAFEWDDAHPIAPELPAPSTTVATQDRVFPHYVPNSSIKHSKSDSKDRSQEIL